MLGTTVALRNGKQWAQRQSADFFVAESRRRGYVARSAFKLLFMDEKFSLFDKKSTRLVVDLGCSPGGWCQVIREKTGDSCALVGIDLLPVRAYIPGARLLQGDFRDRGMQQKLLDCLSLPAGADGGTAKGGGEAPSGLVDVVTSDMCPNRTGGYQDRQRLAELNLSALQFSLPLLRSGGHFVCKVLGDKDTHREVHALAERNFLRTHICKPPASRAQSDETFLVATSKLAEPRRRDLGGSSSYGLDDWPGFARRSPKNHKRGR